MSTLLGRSEERASASRGKVRALPLRVLLLVPGAVALLGALGMLAGYGWLAVAGAIWVLAAPLSGGPAYDASVHAVFLGFTMSMVMVHAPVILPAVVRRPLPYHPALYVPLALLHASLAVRLWLGDALGWELAWRAGGAGNVAALLLFVGVALGSAGRGRR